MSNESMGGGRSPEKREMSETEKESLIRGTYTFDQLYIALEKIGTIPGSQQDFTPDQLKDKIERVRKGELELNYITRTYGLRETVERLLEEVKPSPEKPPELEAAVALELPTSETPDAAKEMSSVPSPDAPPELEASVALELPNDAVSEGDSEIGEGSPSAPISPLTDEEANFYYRAKEEDNDRYSIVYELNLRSAPGRYLNINLPEVEERYKNLKQKLDRYEAVARPSSFEELAMTLQNSSFQDGEEVIDGSELLSSVDKVRSGEMPITELPESIQQGVASLVAKAVFERLTTEQYAAIPEHEWEMFMQARPPVANYLGSRSWVGYPKIGAENVRLKDAVIEGTLVWADTKNAVFMTSDGFRTISADEILMDDGKTRVEKEEEERRRRRGGGAAAMERPLPK